MPAPSVNHPRSYAHFHWPAAHFTIQFDVDRQIAHSFKPLICWLIDRKAACSRAARINAPAKGVHPASKNLPWQHVKLQADKGARIKHPRLVFVQICGYPRPAAAR